MSLKVDLNGLQSNLINSYTELIEEFNNAKKNYTAQTVLCDIYSLSDKLDALKNDVILLCGIQDPNTGTSALAGIEDFPRFINNNMTICPECNMPVSQNELNMFDGLCEECSGAFL